MRLPPSRGAARSRLERCRPRYSACRAPSARGEGCFHVMRSMTSIRYCAIAIAMVMVMCLCGLLPSAASAAQTAPSAPAAEPDDPAQRPKWEAGLVTGAGRVVDYPGADQSHWRGFAAPLFIYRGRLLRVDQDGIRGRLLKTSDIEFDVTGSAAFSARNNDARQGMPPLDYLFGVGPQVI